MRIVLYLSRSKDNKEVIGHKPRKKAFVTNKDFTKLDGDFQKFVNEGLPHETCRMYVSANSRDEEKVKKSLICSLLTKDIDLTRIDSAVVREAAKVENSVEKHWIIVYRHREDCSPIEKHTGLCAFRSDLIQMIGYEPEMYKVPEGAGFVLMHGFDARELMAAYPNITIHRDGLLCVAVKENQDD